MTDRLDMGENGWSMQSVNYNSTSQHFESDFTLFLRTNLCAHCNQFAFQLSFQQSFINYNQLYACQERDPTWFSKCSLIILKKKNNYIPQMNGKWVLSAISHDYAMIWIWIMKPTEKGYLTLAMPTETHDFTIVLKLWL